MYLLRARGQKIQIIKSYIYQHHRRQQIWREGGVSSQKVCFQTRLDHLRILPRLLLKLLKAFVGYSGEKTLGIRFEFCHRCLVNFLPFITSDSRRTVQDGQMPGLHTTLPSLLRCSQTMFDQVLLTSREGLLSFRTPLGCIQYYNSSTGTRCLKNNSKTLCDYVPRQWVSIRKEKSNKMQQCIKILLFHIYMSSTCFGVTHRPSSGA
jgi:hypothetical protein